MKVLFLGFGNSAAAVKESPAVLDALGIAVKRIDDIVRTGKVDASDVRLVTARLKNFYALYLEKKADGFGLNPDYMKILRSSIVKFIRFSITPVQSYFNSNPGKIRTITGNDVQHLLSGPERMADNKGIPDWADIERTLNILFTILDNMRGSQYPAAA